MLQRERVNCLLCSVVIQNFYLRSITFQTDEGLARWHLSISSAQVLAIEPIVQGAVLINHGDDVTWPSNVARIHGPSSSLRLLEQLILPLIMYVPTMLLGP